MYSLEKIFVFKLKLLREFMSHKKFQKAFLETAGEEGAKLVPTTVKQYAVMFAKFDRDGAGLGAQIGRIFTQSESIGYERGKAEAVDADQMGYERAMQEVDARGTPDAGDHGCWCCK
jgi:hypothetical protein